MIDLAQTEVDALLELIAWEREDGSALVQSPTRDAELRSAARKLATPATSRALVEAARDRGDSRAEECNLILAWIARHLLARSDVHLAPVKTDPNGAMPVAVCVHTKRGPMAWRIGEYEAHAYFGHLLTYECEHGAVKREEKLKVLADLASRK